MELKTIFSERGNVLLLIDNFKLRKCNIIRSTSEQRWRCANKNCSASVYTLGSDSHLVFSKREGYHNHEALSDQVLTRNTISNEVKRKAEENLCERPAKLIHRELDPNTIANLTKKDIRYIGNNISHSKLAKTGKLPTSTAEVTEYLDSVEVKNTEGEDFLLHNDKEKSITVFSSEQNLTFLCENQEILLADGTFQFCTKFFLQLFTIHSYSNGYYIPLVFCLLADKKQSTYSEIFRILKEKCQLKGLKAFQPKQIVLDFEMSMHLGIKNNFPNAIILGCRFHLGQAWWRKIQQLGLSIDYKDRNSAIGRWLRYVFGLKYLDAQEVGSGFMDLVAIQPEDTRLENFTVYLAENYVGPKALFSPQIWASATADLWRTTNGCESYHSKFNALRGTPHPNIVKFLHCLRVAQASSSITRNSLGNAEPKRKDVVGKQKFIATKIEQYRNN